MLQLELTIVPPFYMTWWFKALLILIITLGIVGIYRQRINAVKLQKEKLQRLVDQQTHELIALNHQEQEARVEAERSRKEADEANRAKSIFLATMSHEITDTNEWCNRHGYPYFQKQSLRMNSGDIQKQSAHAEKICSV